SRFLGTLCGRWEKKSRRADGAGCLPDVGIQRSPQMPTSARAATASRRLTRRRGDLRIRKRAAGQGAHRVPRGQPAPQEDARGSYCTRSSGYWAAGGVTGALLMEPYSEQVKVWPSEGRHILAQYDDDSIIVYQAYHPAIGRFAAENGLFGG